MAKSLAQFQTEFKAIQQLVGEHNQDIFGNAQLVAQTTGVISEGIKVLGERIQELKDEGRTGADIAAFKDDAEVTKFLGGIDDHLSSLERELTRITRLHQTDFAKTKARFVTLKRDVQAEIAARKKQVSTKLGLGNKSLPDLVKLLTALNTYQDGGAYSPFEVFTPEKMTEHKAIFDKRIKTEISKAKDVRLSEHQKMLQQQALSTRNLKGNLARAKTHMEAVELGVTKAKDALAQRKPKELLAAKIEAAKSMKALNEIAKLYAGALEDDWFKGQLKNSKDKATVEKGVKLVAAMHTQARKSLDEVANARVI